MKINYSPLDAAIGQYLGPQFEWKTVSNPVADETTLFVFLKDDPEKYSAFTVFCVDYIGESQTQIVWGTLQGLRVAMKALVPASP